MLRFALSTLVLAAPVHAQFSSPTPLTNPVLKTESTEFADLDGDGIVELLVASAGASSIGWLAGDGAGHFATFTPLTTEALGAVLVRAADLDLDGDLDVVGGSATDGHIRVWQNLGGPSIHFGPTVVEATAVAGLSDMEIVDVTGDGYPDILAASPDQNRIAILINDGSGGFQHIKVLVGANVDAIGVAALDVDDDGLLDVVGTHKGSASTNYFRNLGGGSFASGVNFASGSPSARDVAAFDADGDGDDDLLLSANGVLYYENLGGGDFGPKVTLTTLSLGRLRVGDFDGDGDIDFAAGSQFGHSGQVYRNFGDGTFEYVLSLPTFSSQSLLDVAAADINADGVVDWALAQSGQDAPRIFLGIGPGLSGGHTVVEDAFLTNNGATDVAIGDFNEDGIGDLVVGSKLDGNVVLFVGLGGGLFAMPVVLMAGETDLVQVLIADFNGDGHDDVASLRTSQARVRVVYNDGNGAFTNGFTALVSGGMSKVSAGDIDGDGDVDLVVARAFQDKLDWYANNGSGSFVFGGSVVSFMDQPVQLQVVDLDGDGLEDVVAGSSVVSGVRWFRNRGAGVFLGAGQELAPYADGASGLDTGDLNDDGLLDLVLAGKVSGQLSVVLQTTAGAFSAPETFFTELLSNVEIELAEVTGDGRLDLVVATSFVNEVRVFSGGGDGSFSGPMTISDQFPDHSSVATGDVDGDGDLDIAFTSFGGDNVAVVLNQSVFEDCNGNGVADFADLASGVATDFNGDGVLDACVAPPLYADGFVLDAAAGGAQTFALDAGVAHAGELFIMVGTLSGTAPGTPLGSLSVPINVDAYTTLLLTTGSIPLAPKFGLLDANGQASAVLNLAPGLANAYVGQTAHHAFVTFGVGYTFASNAVPITIE